MKRFVIGTIVQCFLVMSLLVSAVSAEEAILPWAYPVNPPGTKPPVDDGSLRHVPGSALAFTLSQVNDRYSTADWHPGDHPQLPEIIAHGRRPEVYACGWCHRASGVGGPENANLTGLPAAYIIQQMKDFKSGARKSTVPNRGPIIAFTAVFKNMSDSEIEAAAAYYAALPAQSNVKVEEVTVVPKTFVPAWHLAFDPSAEKEPIGQRIIEAPEVLEQFASRDSRARIIAYVPMGSIKRGEQLAASGDNGRTIQCVLCHGPGLRGVGPIPGIAGRSASYIVRQLYDFKHGMRTGTMSALMKPTVEKLDVDDMIALAAYSASLAP